MDFFNLLGGQLADPFRIALIIGLLITSNNTAPQIGRSIPLVLGVVFVAILIPTAFGTGEHGMVPVVAVGILANLLIFAACWLVLSIIKRVISR
ncbi:MULTISPECIES: hypothetical protein [Mesorhizobium]|uniref:Uncharacterized protein n=1 Tax=Mesorhizobium denitrificans TaxID=2294114 RepID=A0A371XDM9_9HYPH|nr:MULTISPECIES: hypothetical protein [Mesorhizobium]RFC67326.1 hypothetical protein DY251_12320 [Mesorhizobium denitrificans]